MATAFLNQHQGCHLHCPYSTGFSCILFNNRDRRDRLDVLVQNTLGTHVGGGHDETREQYVVARAVQKRLGGLRNKHVSKGNTLGGVTAIYG